MTQRRLFGLLMVLGVWLALKVFDREQGGPTVAASPAVTRGRPVLALPASLPSSSEVLSPTAEAPGRAEPEDDEPRDAFAQRVPPAPAPVQAPRVAAPTPLQAPKPLVEPPSLSPPSPDPPPPAYRVIGTWADVRGASVFIAGPVHTAHVRTGDTLFAEYQVLQISAMQVVLRRLGTQHDYRLAVAQAPAEPR